MPKGPFLPSDFLTTKFSTSADKVDFGNTFLHFIDSEWKQTLFTEKFYNRLSNTFGHIAHYNRLTFYSTWFTCDADRLRFIEHALDWPGVTPSSPSMMWSVPFSGRFEDATTSRITS